ncbi:DinB family protein [Ferviditalea candida]|uniref:DinB family protein n=1 Tax=Ferviditalea candida TaxID=3108399 RepID=A0ABU5ZE66_9BACL|nr:DinB family protein [Paenibacillaceae bacterium T2]
MEAIQPILAKRFEEIEKRILSVLDQLNDDHVNWRPNESSNSIANIIMHLRGNIGERVTKGIHHKDFARNRDQEFETVYASQSELRDIIRQSFQELIETARNISEEGLQRTQTVRNAEITNLDLLVQMAAHSSEHMGQILYIAKICLDDKYITTTIPKKRDKQAIDIYNEGR